MRVLKKLSFGIALVILVASCRKVIKIDLNSGDPKFVIEAVVTNSIGTHTVQITTTKNFDQDNNFEGVTGANVSISDNAGNVETLIMASPGVYQTTTLTGVPGRTYYLNVDINGEKFNSICTMPNAVNLDTTFVFDFTDFGDTIKIVNAMYFDPAGITNYYKHNLIVNGKRTKSINISNDQATDGSLTNRGIFYRENGKFLKAGDSVTVEMLCIEKAVHLYFFSLNQTISQSAAAPANPVSNIEGSALGYFSAHTFQKKFFVVQ